MSNGGTGGGGFPPIAGRTTLAVATSKALPAIIHPNHLLLISVSPRCLQSCVSKLQTVGAGFQLLRSLCRHRHPPSQTSRPNAFLNCCVSGNVLSRKYTE